MNKCEFIEYNSDTERYGIDEFVAKTIADMFDGREYQSSEFSKRNMVSFTASK